jgi:hypothetical protein
VAPASASPHAPTQRTSLGSAALRLLGALVLPAPVAAQQAAGAPGPFDHARHVSVECTACHSARDAHGTVTITTQRECRTCHHTGAVAQPCSRCHGAAGAESYDVRRAYRPSVGVAKNRTLPFDHRPHEGLDCARCHREGIELSAARVSCSSCHVEHHDAGTTCTACHETPRESAHSASSHLTCAGSGCHSAAPVNAAQRTRNLCLACHQDMGDHRPGRRCVECHTLPPARQSDDTA